VVSHSSNPLIAYLTRHWRGEFRLLYAFSINFIAVSLLIYGVAQLLRNLWQTQAAPLFYLNLLVFLIYWLIIFPWQAVGVIRSSEKTPGTLRNTLWIMPIQVVVIFSTILFFTGGTSLVQSGYALSHQEDPRFMEIFFGDPDYQLSVDADEKILTIDGLFDNGLTADLRRQLEQYPSVHTVHLHSSGGSIYEARGVAKLIMERQLNTSADQECSSGCTTAFIAGKQRHLAPAAKLGFHRYRLEATYTMPNQQKSIETAQQQDLQFFLAQGVSAAFMDKVFRTPHEAMWFPTHEELSAAGVIKQVIKQ
jgi:hypothetical protein